MSIPDIHDALVAMEQVGLRPQCMALRCQHAGCREEIQIDTGEPTPTVEGRGGG